MDFDPSQGLSKRFHLKDPEAVKRYVVGENLHGRERLKAWALVVVRRIIHLITSRAWITDSRLTTFTEKARGLATRKVQNILQAGGEDVDTAIKDVVEKIRSYVILFHKTSLEQKVSSAMAGNFEEVINEAGVNFSEDDVVAMQSIWERHDALGYCEEGFARKKLASIILNSTMKHPESVKRNFALMHADSQLAQDPVLERFQGAEKVLTGHYFLHFAEKQEDFKWLVDYLKPNLEHYQRFFLAHMHTKGGAKFQEMQVDVESERICREISNMEPEGFQMLLGNWFFKEGAPHAVAYIIYNEGNGLLGFTVVNTGAGAETNHTWEGDKLIPYVVVSNVLRQNFCHNSGVKELVKMTRNVVQLDDTDSFYDGFLKGLGGQRVESDIPITPQRSGSCSLKLFQAIFRRFSKRYTYKNCMYTMKVQSMIHFFELFEKDFENDEEAKKLLQIAFERHQVRKQKLDDDGIIVDDLLSDEEKAHLAEIEQSLF